MRPRWVTGPTGCPLRFGCGVFDSICVADLPGHSNPLTKVVCVRNMFLERMANTSIQMLHQQLQLVVLVSRRQHDISSRIVSPLKESATAHRDRVEHHVFARRVLWKTLAPKANVKRTQAIKMESMPKTFGCKSLWPSCKKQMYCRLVLDRRKICISVEI